MVEIFQTRSSVDTSTLTAVTTVVLDAALKNLKEPFLLTKLRVAFTLTYPDTDDLVMALLVYGDATTTEIDGLMAGDSAVDPEAADDYRVDQLAARRLIAYVALPTVEVAGAAASFTWDVQLPKGGSPFAKGDGPQLLIFNPRGSAHTDGPQIFSVSRWMGAWMGR